MAEGAITETIEYLTQIHTSWNGKEQRVGLREYPRRTISYKYNAMNNQQSIWMRGYTMFRKGCMVQFPLWHGCIQTPTNIYSDESRITVNKENVWDYRDCSSAMFWDNDDIGGISFDIDFIDDSGEIRFARKLTKNYKKSLTKIIPVCYGYVTTDDSSNNETTTVSDIMMTVELVRTAKTIDLPETYNEYKYPRLRFDTIAINAPNEYNGLELFMYPPQWVDPDTSVYDFHGERLDNNSGTFRYYINSNERKVTRTTNYLAKTKEEIHFLERFFYRCKGMLHSFYMPTWTNDFELSTNAYKGSKELQVKFSQYYKYYASSDRRKTLCVFFNGGQIMILEVSLFTYSKDGTKGRIRLKEALTRSMYISDVRMISFLVCARHNTDTMTVNYETVNTALISFETTEVDE